MTKGRERVLILTPTGRDAALISQVLSRSGILVESCPDARTVAKEIGHGAGVAVFAEEALTNSAASLLGDALASQPAWSDLPVLVLSSSQTTQMTEYRLGGMAAFRNVTVIERPVRPATLTSIVNAALRARRRQYEVESLLNQLKIAEERLRTMIESAQDYAIVGCDPAGRITFWNAGAWRLLGYSEDAILGKPYQVLFPALDTQAGVPDRELAEALETGRASSEGWRRRRDGSLFWASGVISPTRDSGGRAVGFVEVLRDMTERKGIEERLAGQARALEQSNQDLQQFAYAASHDLQEPLRMIASYSQLLVRKSEGALDGDSKEYVKFILAGVDRMRTLIQDLLDFSRLTAEGTRPAARVDCNALLGLVLQHLQLKISESQARIRFERLPVVIAHESRLFQVFQNLLGNAIKYCEGRPEIHVSATRDGAFWRISVRDNGIGIAPEHQEKVFGLFQRLHHSSEYPGSGIGLATCKRIVEQSGGRIWLESNRGGGTTFHFTIPAIQESEGPEEKAS